MVLGLNPHFLIYVVPLVAIETWLFDYAFSADPRTCQVIIGLLGLFWCFAALWVEIRLELIYPGFNYEKPQDPEMKAYRPFCDFAPWANCSKVLMSPPGRFLRYFGIAKEGDSGPRGWIDVPNPTLGVLFFSCHLFYPLLLELPIPKLAELFFAANCLVGVMTVWLAYNLVFVLSDFCVVCVSMYVANFGAIPMMYQLALGDGRELARSPLGAVPVQLALPFGLLDLLMGLGVLVLLCKPAHARECGEEEPSQYLPIL